MNLEAQVERLLTQLELEVDLMAPRCQIRMSDLRLTKAGKARQSWQRSKHTVSVERGG